MSVLKKAQVVLSFLVFFCFPPVATADDTCCVGHGGDYSCNAATSQLYCADGTVSTTCTCQIAPTATPTPVPTQIPVVSTPACPVNAAFSTSANACTCNAGYVVSTNSCVTYATYCQAHYGTNSLYDSGSNACACASGYSWNTDGTSCVTMDAVCNEKIGSKSYYNSSDNSCYCYSGYSIQNNQCQLVPTPVPPATVAPTTGVPIAQPTAVPIPTIAAVVVPTHAPLTPTKVPSKKVQSLYDYHKKVPGLNGFIAVKKQKPSGFFENLFTTILDALKKAFNI